MQSSLRHVTRLEEKLIPTILTLMLTLALQHPCSKERLF
jgi:hypothetical protein